MTAVEKKRDDELIRLLGEANDAKDRLARLARKLEAAGYVRKANSCMTLVCRIEEWQRKR